MDVDETLITTEMWDISNIAAEIGNNKDEDVEDDEEDAAKVPSIHTTFYALETLQDFFKFISRSERTLSHQDELEKAFINSSWKQNQTFIDDFFVKKM